MKWKAYWWGIELIVETPEDRKLLKELSLTLFVKADNKYDDGLKEEELDEHGQLVLLRFKR